MQTVAMVFEYDLCRNVFSPSVNDLEVSLLWTLNSIVSVIQDQKCPWYQ